MPTASELRELEDDELEGRLAEYRREMLNLRFQLATGQLDNFGRLSTVRKDVARVLSILRDREIALAEGRHAGPVVSTRPARRRAPDDVDVDVEDEEAPARRPRPSRSKTVAEAPEPVDDEGTPAPEHASDEEDE
jgi:large subunit ribosomal protein L29